MTSLIFRALDRHIIDGRADHLAIDDGTSSLTFAQLLAQTAALAGGLAHVGVREGMPVFLDVQGAAEVSAVLSLARLGAIPASATLTQLDTGLRIAGDPPIVHTGEYDYAWATILSAGKTDPLPAPELDEPGYEELMLEKYREIFTTLAAGKTLT